MVFRRFIILMISLVFVNILLICHEINIQSENRFNHFFENLVIIFRQTLLFIILILESRLITIIMVKTYRITSETFWYIENGLFLVSLAMVYIYFKSCLSNQWTRYYRIEMHCFELILNQIISSLCTYIIHDLQFSDV